MADDAAPKAIETIHRGYRCRSRLEARWMVLLDTLRVPFEYEPEGYDLEDCTGKVWYLPDFWLPRQRTWLEVKGQLIVRNDPTWIKARALASATDCPVVVFCGQIGTPGNLMGLHFFGPEDDSTGFEPSPVWWFRCLVCGLWQLGRHVYELPCDCVRREPGDDQDLVRACLAARQARFEQGR